MCNVVVGDVCVLRVVCMLHACRLYAGCVHDLCVQSVYVMYLCSVFAYVLWVCSM